MPVGVDVVEPAMLFELQAVGLDVRDGQQIMLDARELKSAGRDHAAQHVGGAWSTAAIRPSPRHLKPGIRENEIVALANKRLYELGLRRCRGDQRDLGRALQPASAQLHRPADPPRRPGVLRHHPVLHAAIAPAITAPSMSAALPTRNRMPIRTRANGSTRRSRWSSRASRTDKIAACWPKAEEIGFTSEMEAFGLLFGHGLGLGLHERPIISRLNSFDDPMEIKAGMVFALETYCPATDGFSAARIEEESWSPGRRKVITLYPAENCRSPIGTDGEAGRKGEHKG